MDKSENMSNKFQHEMCKFQHEMWFPTYNKACSQIDVVVWSQLRKSIDVEISRQAKDQIYHQMVENVQKQ